MEFRNEPYKYSEAFPGPLHFYNTLRHYQKSNTQIQVSFDDGINITKKALTYFGTFYSIFNVYFKTVLMVNIPWH